MQTDSVVVKDVKERIHKDVELFTGGEVERGLRGAMIGAMNKYVVAGKHGDKNYYRRCVLGYIFDEESGELSTHDLDDAQWFALYRWIEPWKDEDDNKWKTRDEFPVEISAVFHATCVSIATDTDVVKDPLFGDDGQPSEYIRYLVEQGGEITEVIEDTLKESLLSQTNFKK